MFRAAIEALKTTPLNADRPGDGRGYARAHNFLFDEYVGDARKRMYLDHLALTHGTAELLQERHAHYIGNRIQTITSMPPTFLLGNERAIKKSLNGNQTLARLEIINSPLQAWVNETEQGGDLEAAFTFFKKRLDAYHHGTQFEKDEARASLEEWLEPWNENLRDNRPVFATFADDVAPWVEEEQWAVALRTHLGLAHINPRENQKTYVALMHYSVAEIEAAFLRMHAPDVLGAFAVPTVLDGAIWEYFFPAPMNPHGAHESYGRSMPLEPTEDTGQLVAELLHVKLDYQPKHLYKVGVLNTPIPDHAVRVLRNAHLDALRVETELDTFGEYIPEPEAL